MDKYEQLIKDYLRKLATIGTMLADQTYTSIDQAVRIKTKASCYRSFISELRRDYGKEKKAIGVGFVPSSSFAPILVRVKLKPQQHVSYNKWKMTFEGEVKIVMMQTVEWYTQTFEAAAKSFNEEEVQEVSITSKLPYLEY